MDGDELHSQNFEARVRALEAIVEQRKAQDRVKCHTHSLPFPRPGGEPVQIGVILDGLMARAQAQHEGAA